MRGDDEHTRPCKSGKSFSVFAGAPGQYCRIYFDILDLFQRQKISDVE